MIDLMVLSRLAPVIFMVSVSLSCNDRTESKAHPSGSCREPKKIVVYKENVYDLNGYADEGGGDPFCLFDENALVDPGNSPGEAYQPHTNPQPTQQPKNFPSTHTNTNPRPSARATTVFANHANAPCFLPPHEHTPLAPP